ncbi:hypothetical protein A2U01_0077303, partial [Trifolium medium]|nr:hypothetical protein [Trifolium medium]
IGIAMGRQWLNNQHGI